MNSTDYLQKAKSGLEAVERGLDGYGQRAMIPALIAIAESLHVERIELMIQCLAMIADELLETRERRAFALPCANEVVNLDAVESAYWTDKGYLYVMWRSGDAESAATYFGPDADALAEALGIPRQGSDPLVDDAPNYDDVLFERMALAAVTRASRTELCDLDDYAEQVRGAYNLVNAVGDPELYNELYDRLYRTAQARVKPLPPSYQSLVMSVFENGAGHE